MKVPRKIKKKIPKGRYCYTPIKYENHIYHVKPCPFYFQNRLGYGDCKLLFKIDHKLNGEDDDLDFCLDDQCKSCGIKIE